MSLLQASLTAAASSPSPKGGGLRPKAALLHPVWLGSLGLLILNDHVLKGAGVLPGAVTGKLSDVAGLVVAPYLLATLLRVQTRRGLALAFAAVASVFAAIQLSAAAAAGWTQLWGLVGVPWSTTMDPTDLLAIAVMPLAWSHLMPTLVAPASAAERKEGLHRLAGRAAVGTGLVACVATSPNVPPGDEFYSDIFAAVYVHNASDNDVNVLLRPLRDDVQLDCLAIAADPGALLPDAAFGQGVLWSMPPRTNISASQEGEASQCTAVHISGDSFPAMILFWDASHDFRWYPGLIDEGGSAPSGGVLLNFDDEGSFVDAIDSGVKVHYAPKAAPEPDACVVADEAARLDWVGMSNGQFQLTTIDAGLDGCMRLGFDNAQTAVASYLCMPAALFPFAEGDVVSISSLQTESHLVIADADASLPRELHLVRGTPGSIIPGLEIGTRARPSCAQQVDQDCATVQRSVEQLVVGAEGSASLNLEEPNASLPYDQGRNVDLQLVYAAQRALVDVSCANGTASLGAELEYVALVSPQG